MAELDNPNAAMDYKEGVIYVYHALSGHFGREATYKEIYRYLWGSPETRQWILDNKGLPENQR